MPLKNYDEAEVDWFVLALERIMEDHNCKSEEALKDAAWEARLANTEERLWLFDDEQDEPDINDIDDSITIPVAVPTPFDQHLAALGVEDVLQ